MLLLLFAGGVIVYHRAVTVIINGYKDTNGG